MNIVVLGGGTGTFTVLSGLKLYPDAQLSAIISIADSGGSSGKLRNELGVLPPGDVRQCLVALAQSSELMLQLFNYRPIGGSLQGHPIGNIFISALEQMTGDPLKAIDTISEILNIRGRVIPVSATAADLAVELVDETVIHHEHHIDQHSRHRARIKRCFLENTVTPNPEALAAILNADLIVIGPGDLYTSLIPVLLVPEITQTLNESRGQKVYVLNLATKPGQTNGFTATHFYQELSAYLQPAKLDAILVNSTTPSNELIQFYESAGECLVSDDLDEKALNGTRILRKPLLAHGIAVATANDQLRRSLLRHDSHALAKAIIEAANDCRISTIL